MTTRTRDYVVAEALSWIDTPFVHSAAVKGVGVDCAHLVKDVGVRSGFEFNGDLPAYGTTPDIRVMSKELERYLDPIPFRSVREGDLLWFKSEGLLHLGIVVESEPLTMVHAHNGRSRQKVILTRVFGEWRKSIVGCYRYRGIEG